VNHFDGFCHSNINLYNDKSKLEYANNRFKSPADCYSVQNTLDNITNSEISLVLLDNNNNSGTAQSPLAIQNNNNIS